MEDFENLVNLSSTEVLVLLSGGLDSAACLNFFIDIGRPTSCLFIDYQQPAIKQESCAAKSIANYYDVALYKAQWRGQSVKNSGFIAARNAFLLMAALMECPKQITTVALGIHAGTNYPDCSPAFLDLMQNIFNIYSKGSIRLAAPFVDWKKADIWEYAQSNGIPIDKTYSCEAGQTPTCGHCLSCLDRKEFEAHA